MKILEVIPNLQAGGAETFIVNLSNALASIDGNEVTILTLYQPNESEFLRGRIDKRVKVESLNKHKGIDIRMLFSVLRFVKQGNFDIAHFHVQAIIYSLLSCLFVRKTKYFATIHNDAFKEATGVHRLARKILFKLKLCKAITISADSENSFKDLYTAPSTLIYNGVQRFNKSIDNNLRNRFKASENVKLFVNAASFIGKKNQLAIARATNKLRNEETILLGKVWDENYYRQVKREESEAVIIMGEVSNPIDYMAVSDFFILPSFYEGMPISLLEAMSVGCVPIVTPVGGCKNVVSDGHDGLICPSPEEADVYKTMKKAMSLKEEQLQSIKKNISSDFEKYTIDKCAELHMKLFENAITK